MSLRTFIRRQQPLTVSLVSFLLMVAVVTSIGLLGGNHLVRYLERQLVEHGLEHNREVLERLRPLLEEPLFRGESDERVLERFRAFSDRAEPFGVRLFLFDAESGRVLADSRRPSAPYPLARLLETPLHGLDGKPVADPARWVGPAWRLLPDGRVRLLLVEPVSGGTGQWRLGVSSDFGRLLEFMEELHLHLDGVLLLTYGLIGLVGFLVLRRVGRSYEASLEAQVRRRTEALEAAHRRLLDQARLAAIGQTASVLAHEMRNPLASMKLALSGLARGASLEARERQRLELVLGEVDRLDRLLHDTLDYVRPVVPDETPVSLDLLLDQVLELEAPLVEQAGLRLRRERCDSCCELKLDRAKMRQVLLNLLRNAREASPQGGEITVRLEPADGGMRLEIANPGGPLPAEVRERAFDFFFTTRARGTGLGLGLVKRVVEEHGGRVGLDGEKERVVLRLELPCPEDAEG